MKKYTVFFSIVLLAVAFRAPAKAPEYKVCFGNTHAHCNYSGDIAVFRAKKGLSSTRRTRPKATTNWPKRTVTTFTS